MTTTGSVPPRTAAAPRRAGSLPGGFTGLGTARRWSGALLLVAGFAALVLAREPVREVAYAGPVLLGLVLVVASALIGGVVVALPGAIAGTLLLNWFFTPPFGTLWIDSSEQVVVLAAFPLRAPAVSA